MSKQELIFLVEIHSPLLTKSSSLIGESLFQSSKRAKICLKVDCCADKCLVVCLLLIVLNQVGSPSLWVNCCLPFWLFVFSFPPCFFVRVGQALCIGLLGSLGTVVLQFAIVFGCAVLCSCCVFYAEQVCFLCALIQFAGLSKKAYEIP